MLACQMHLPDRKGLVGALLLFGLAVGVATYSGLTSIWARHEAKDGDVVTGLAFVLTRLCYCMLGHTLLAVILLAMPRQ